MVLDYCAPSGEQQRTTVSKTKGDYAAARKAQWGDVWTDDIVGKRIIKVARHDLAGHRTDTTPLNAGGTETGSKS